LLEWLPLPPLSHGASASPTSPMGCQPSQRFGLAKIGPGGIVVFLLFVEIFGKINSSCSNFQNSIEFCLNFVVDQDFSVGHFKCSCKMKV
jgi:hypothetical protein